MDGLGFRQLIHKHFHIPGMVRHIGSRTGITRIQNIAHNVGLVSACHKENQLLGIKKQTAGHGYALLPIVRINTYLVRMERRKQILRGKWTRYARLLPPPTEQYQEPESHARVAHCNALCENSYSPHHRDRCYRQ